MRILQAKKQIQAHDCHVNTYKNIYKSRDILFVYQFIYRLERMMYRQKQIDQHRDVL